MITQLQISTPTFRFANVGVSLHEGEEPTFSLQSMEILTARHVV